MLNIYYGRESVDKEKFMYQTINKRGFGVSAPVLVLVPDQYTLEAERRAFEITGKDALIGLDIYSISRLGHNTLSKLGTGGITFIDKYGRQMLLTRVVQHVQSDLVVYSESARKPMFIEMMNDLISGFKQYGVTPEILGEMIERSESEDALTRKLRDIKTIFTEYNKEIKGKYTDSEDYVDLFISKMHEYELIKRSSVWVYGFDSFAPKSLALLAELMKTCRELNVVLTHDKGARDSDLFELTGTVMRELEKQANENGTEIGSITAINDIASVAGEFDMAKESREIIHLERELFSSSPKKFVKPENPDDREDIDNDGPDGITIVKAANFQNEAESAASYILKLVREDGLRYRDIVVICNDQATRGPILERVFDEYDIPVFNDKKRDLEGSNMAVYIVSMIRAVRYGLRTEDVFKALKTGVSGLPPDDIEILENYTYEYRIDRSKWGKEFTHGESEYGSDLARIEEIRKEAISSFETLASIEKASKTYGDFIHEFYAFMDKDLAIRDSLMDIIGAQREMGLIDLAEETSQVWDKITSILSQIEELMGEDPFDLDEFLQIFEMGLRQVEVGVLPATPDDLIVGTMQRTRPGNVKAVVVVGANEGVIPEEISNSGLFANDEIERLSSAGHDVGKVDFVRRQEEKLAMYRDLSRASDALWIGYSVSDLSGNALKPSELITDIHNILDNEEERTDVVSIGHIAGLIGGKTSTLRHLTEALIAAKHGDSLPPLWASVYNWYKVNDPDDLERVTSGLEFENDPDDLDEDTAKIMLRISDGDMKTSASALERYANCPFSYFISRGLRAEEKRVFEAGSREIGDVYHEVVMKVTQGLTDDDKWGDVTDAELKDRVKSAIKSELETYRDKLFDYTGSERYRYSRIENTLMETMEILVKHARAGKIKESRYEEPFGTGRKIKPIELETDAGTVYIEGKIDRLDVLENESVKIIDYKSSDHSISEDEIKAGYRLQLMIYMKAARGDEREPAGVFYFRIGSDINAANKNDDISELIDYKEESASPGSEKARDLAKALEDRNTHAAAMNGIVVKDDETIDEMMGTEGLNVIGVTRNKPKKPGEKGEISKRISKSACIDLNDFDKLQKEAEDKAREIAQNITQGKIPIHPIKLKGSNWSGCQYCDYKSICRFDPVFKGCRYRTE